jgi:hypothetical protein
MNYWSLRTSYYSKLKMHSQVEFQKPRNFSGACCKLVSFNCLLDQGFLESAQTRNELWRRATDGHFKISERRLKNPGRR